MTTARSKRQGFLGPESDGILSSALVGIIGLCGGGSHIAQQLAYIGVEHFQLFDPDHVEDANLNRMVGSSPADVIENRLKVNVIRDQILRIRPSAVVEPIALKWQEVHLRLRECTAVFGCVDSFSGRNELEAYCRRFFLPYIDIGMDVHEISPKRFTITGQVIASLPGWHCMQCMGFLTEARIAEEAKRYGDAGDRPQVVWPNGVLASTAVGMFVSLVTPWDSKQEFVPFIEYDGNRHELHTSSVVRALGSKRCQHYPLPEAIGDPIWDGVRV